MKKFENILKVMIVASVTFIAVLYWLAFGYGNHLANLVTLFNYTF